MGKPRQSHNSTPRARVRITLNGHQYLMRAPKKYRLVQMQNLADEMQTLQETIEANPDDKLARDAASTATQELITMITKLFMDDDATKTRKSSRVRFLERLEDDDDDLDLDDAGSIIQLVVERTQGQNGPTARPTS